MNLDDEKFFREIGYRIRERRHARGWTQAELARQCDVQPAYIGFVERGERNVSLVNLRRIAKVLHLPLSELFKGLN
jgi:transcriptional regulator with XRE-family HTH domain